MCEHSPQMEYQSQCITDVYWKDFKHLTPHAASLKINLEYDEPEPQALTCRWLMALWLKEVIKGLKKFLYEGSLHGIKYIFEPSFGRKERATWIIIMAVSISFCAANIIQLFSKWNSAPFVNVMDSLPTPVWAVPFPTVVLCPQIHVKLSHSNVSELNGTRKFFASLMCPQMLRSNKGLQNRLDHKEQKDLEQFIIKATPSCSDLVKKCYWGSSDNESWRSEDCCTALFRPVFTNYGLCQAFNILPLNGMTNKTSAWYRTFDENSYTEPIEWSLDHGYSHVYSHQDQPFRAKASGENYGFGAELFLNSSEHQHECDGTSSGFNLLISSPIDHIYTSTVLKLPMDRTTAVEVSPLSYKTDPTLRSLKPEKRQCYFQHEKKLNYYSVYTDSNCKHDLLVMESRRRCKCVDYKWPRQNTYESICSTLEDFQCLNAVKAKLEEELIQAYFDETEHHTLDRTTSRTCYPSCNDIMYSSQVFYSDLRKEVLGNSRSGVLKRGEVTRVNIYFYDDMFLGLHRHAQYDDYYFVGAIGGLLSLFLGFSIISLAELVYYIVLGPLQTVLDEIYRHC